MSVKEKLDFAFFKSHYKANEVFYLDTTATGPFTTKGSFATGQFAMKSSLLL